MKGETLQRKVTIRNPQGFHVRPAAAFAQSAARFQCRVTLVNAGQRVDGRRALDLLMLDAGPGAEIILEVSGPDAAEALEVLAEVLAAHEPPPAPLPPKG